MIRIENKGGGTAKAFAETSDAYIGYPNQTSGSTYTSLIAYFKKDWTQQEPVDGKLKSF